MPKDLHPTLTTADLSNDILERLKRSVGKDPDKATDTDWRLALSLAIRDKVVDPWFESTRRTYAEKGKRVYYLSLEFLIGRLIEDVTVNLGLEKTAKAAMDALGQDYDALVVQEPDAALGNGGLGRRAACFMDSLSTLGIPAYGYGIRYEHGLFEQHFQDGQQVETAEAWLSERHVWEFERPEVRYEIGFGGHVDYDAARKATWHPGETVIAQAYDTPVVGWEAKWVNTLRLWSARPVKNFDLAAFNRSDYIGAQVPEALARTLSRVLYPDDTTDGGKELRLKQEYFFTAASLHDILRRFESEGYAITSLADHVAIQLNDTHPALAGPELVRILVDLHGMDFDKAMTLARNCLGYTNHTLLPEALERWSEEMFARVLPRHHAIVHEIQNRTLAQAGVPIVEHGQVKMGELAFIMAHRVNGVSALHSELVKETVFADLHKAYPTRIINQTNGITPRRWLHAANPALSELITDTIGDGWVADLERLRGIEPATSDAGFRDRFAAAKRENKLALSDWLVARGHTPLNPAEPRRDVRHPDQADPRIQTPASEHPRNCGPVERHARRATSHMDAARQDLRRQGCARLSHGQADHPPDQRRGHGSQRRSGHRQVADGRLSRKLQRLDGRTAGPRLRPVRTDQHSGKRGIRHGQHEAVAERCFDGRHA